MEQEKLKLPKIAIFSETSVSGTSVISASEKCEQENFFTQKLLSTSRENQKNLTHNYSKRRIFVKYIKK